MAESTLEARSGFEHGTSGLGIQPLNHEAIAYWNNKNFPSFYVLSSGEQAKTKIFLIGSMYEFRGLFI